MSKCKLLTISCDLAPAGLMVTVYDDELEAEYALEVDYAESTASLTEWRVLGMVQPTHQCERSLDVTMWAAHDTGLRREYERLREERDRHADVMATF